MALSKYRSVMGWLTSEELVWHPQSGKLLTHAPSTYKIPTANDVPEAFNTRLFDNANVADSIKGFGQVKERNLAAARLRWAELLKA